MLQHFIIISLALAAIGVATLRALLSTPPRAPLPSELTYADLDSTKDTARTSPSPSDPETKPRRRKMTKSSESMSDAQSSPGTSITSSNDWTRKPLPDIGKHSAEVTLSVVVPSYNEEKRLPNTLLHMHRFLESRVQSSKLSVKKSSNGSVNHVRRDDADRTSDVVPIHSFEILVVDDGSKDGTSNCALDVAMKIDSRNIRVLTLEKNRGKGGAVIQGILHSRGEYVIFADADDAARFEDVDLLLAAARKSSDKHGRAVCVGSRAHLVTTEAVVKRSFLRNFLMYGFHTYLHLMGISNIADTQCGFKLFTRPAACEIFPGMHVEGWIFDIEILLLADMMRIPVKEIAISWHEVPGSKMSLGRDSIKMAIDLLVIRMNYLLGFWQVPTRLQ
ncbi:glycosyltransferase family 2 protein [Gonapodya prolifera JEL478]|uniref:dolichyl-phosphate beta-glucosyltransferase n=1 Tax=Gonapodya prolifera (strain JEL478) TaxID=1344416 RepID=A0A139AUE2_GONPJ|nr:glycosyltransferase family 2 protein [Gonapodya prolifera JEL478]|eukprot:KXS20338.1 glycosyltransferase family 2 protein [Gonapodya prolifera JEL478]